MRVLILGGGMMAEGLIHDFENHGDNEIVVAEKDPARALEVAKKFNTVSVYGGDASAPTDAFIADITACDIVISTLPYDYNYQMAKLSIKCGTHFIDLGGNNDVVEKQISELDKPAKDKKVIVMPDCGLAPGLASVLAIRAMNKIYGPWGEGNNYQEIFGEETPNSEKHPSDATTHIKIRVGGLPLKRNNPLQYQKVFSIHGLVNEYIEPVEILEYGERKIVPPMTGLESIRVGPYKDLEAFYTSGGLSTLAKTVAGPVSLDYKTIRYAGHCNIMGAILDLFVDKHRDDLERMLEGALSIDGPDMILIKVVASTPLEYGEHKVYVLECVHYATPDLSAMAIMTAFPAAITARMIVDGDVVGYGALQQEKIPHDKMIEELGSRGISFTESVNYFTPR